MGEEVAIRAEEATVGPPRAPRLQAVSLTVPYGMSLCLYGPNGSGKSTLLAALAGCIRLRSGTVEVHGRDPFTTPTARNGVGTLLNDGDLAPDEKISAALLHLARLQGLQDPRGAVDAVLQKLHIRQLAKLRTRETSSGARRRAALAAALMGDPPLLLLDEPCSNLDAEMQENVRRFLASWRGRRTVVISSHRSEDIAACSHVAELCNGKVVDVRRVSHPESAFGREDFSDRPDADECVRAISRSRERKQLDGR